VEDLAKVSSWRRANDFASDKDFAFAFATAEEAMEAEVKP
jgi:hypothetical protein